MRYIPRVLRALQCAAQRPSVQQSTDCCAVATAAGAYIGHAHRTGAEGLSEIYLHLVG